MNTQSLEQLVEKLLECVVCDGVSFTIEDDETFGDVVDELLATHDVNAEHLDFL